jgi:hypothetical protein
MPDRETELGVERQCRFCRDWWPLDFFRRAKDCRGGRMSQCSSCWRSKFDPSCRRRAKVLPLEIRPRFVSL